MDNNVPRKRKRASATIDDPDEQHSFFTVIVSPATQLHKLKLPKKFVIDHGKRLPDSALLHVQDGETYPVELLKLNSEVFLHKGWNQFATNYSIEAGTFLVFSLHGYSKFLVLIFDAITALEIDYHPTNLHQIPERNGEFEAPKVETTKEAEKPRKSPLERAKAFQSEKPNFIIQIHRRNLSFNSGPWLPTDHCRAHFKEKDGDGNIILIVNNKSWTVDYRLDKTRTCCASMAFGWREFAVDNKLEEGDICLFEKIKSSPNTYRVLLFRVSDDDKEMAKPILKDEVIKDNTPTETSCTKGPMEKVEAFVGNTPGFIVRMRETYISGLHSVYVSTSHSKQYLKDEGDDLNVIAINGENGKAWIVKYHIEESYPRLGAGWAKFRSDNDLQVGDVCAFKLINKARKIYKLAIFRGNANEKTTEDGILSSF